MRRTLGSLGHAVVAVCLAATLQGPAGARTVRESALVESGARRSQPNAVVPAGREWKPAQPGRIDSPLKAVLVRPARIAEAGYRDVAAAFPTAPVPLEPASLAFSLYSIGPPATG